MSEHPLRDLARRIDSVVAGHPAASQASGAVRNLTDHLCAIAGHHEQMHQLQQAHDVMRMLGVEADRASTQIQDLTAQVEMLKNVADAVGYSDE